ncbi:hypothetical protein O181_122205 [Austropuccinia psidii MF-1]|uniref:Retrotransposon gag domain-containing protein n=1 Tax=Austropuccinia psidii MF-1 TaxID=1389203 RepID=A0A9Q3KNR1_9BASI|nr:hypothetical protein [Austropuccinia psidii MF-1]
MMEQMTQFMGKLTQAVAPRDTSKVPAFKTPQMKAPESFDGTKAYKLRGFIQSCQLIFPNDPANFFSDRKKDPSYLLNNWQLFETQLFTLFSNPNEVRKPEKELDHLRMKDSGQVYRRGLASRLLDQLPSHPGNFDSLQELMDITSEFDTRYHERQKEKVSHQENEPPISGPNSSKHPQSSSSKKPYHRKNKKGKNFQVSKDKPHAALLTKDNKLIGSEKERRIKEGLCNYCGAKHLFEKCFKRPENRQVSSKGFPSKQGKA